MCRFVIRFEKKIKKLCRVYDVFKLGEIEEKIVYRVFYIVSFSNKK